MRADVDELKFIWLFPCVRERSSTAYGRDEADEKMAGRRWSAAQPLEPTPFAVWLARSIFGPRALVLEESALPPKLELPAAANARMRRALLRKIAAMISQFFWSYEDSRCR